MGEVKGFMTHDRKELVKQPIEERVVHYKEFMTMLSDEELQAQGSRCMDCGIPFCHSGCPVSNLIPDWNDLIFKGLWKDASVRLHKTNNFPEFTGRVCPAPCEHSCCLGYNYPSVSIKNIELAIVERAFQEGWIVANPPKVRTGLKVAVIGSGPAGLALADQLNKLGHLVTVFEKNEYCGGLLRIGIPDFKLEKHIVSRRLNVMERNGIKFKVKAHVGGNVSVEELEKKFDAIVLSMGAEQPRDLSVTGRDLKGVYFAMDYLGQQNRINAGQKISDADRISAEDKHVIILGGGDTGSDCVGTANRQGAKSIKQFELLPEPPKERDSDNPWPQWANTLRTSTSHQEGVERDYCIMTKRFNGEEGVLKSLYAERVAFGEKDPTTKRAPMKEVAGSGFEVQADLVFLAMGFLGPVKNGCVEQLGVDLDGRGNVQTNDNFMTSKEGVFACGDVHSGQSLVVRAINEGRKAASNVDTWLMANKATK